MRLPLALALVLLAIAAAVIYRVERAADSRPADIRAAESVYADLAAQLGGRAAKVAGLAPLQRGAAASDPKGSNLIGADILLRNGGPLDDWTNALLGGARRRPQVLTALDFAHDEDRANPYVWYDFKAMKRLASALSAAIEQRDPNKEASIRLRLRAFQQSMDKLDASVAKIRKFYRNSTVILTDRLYEDMMKPLGFKIADARYLRNLARFGRPVGDDLQRLRNDVANRKASILIYNSDKQTPFQKGLLKLAQKVDVPAVGVRETKPSALSYQAWMLRQLDAMHGALNEAAP